MNLWPFDQAPNVAALTTRQVLTNGFPILTVVHYADDHSWAFLCGTTSETQDGRIIGMATALKIDPSLAKIADLQPGWIAHRGAIGAAWTKMPHLEAPSTEGATDA